MIGITFYVEGPSDRKFLQDIILKWYGINLNDNQVNVLDGKDNLESRFEEAIRLNRPNFLADKKGSQPKKSIVLLDADNNIIQRKQTIQRQADEYGFSFFLWPDNKLSGDLESVLERIYNPTQQAFFDCWQDYEKCLSQYGNYYLPNRKGKIFAYLESMLGHTESQQDLIRKPHKRNFLNEDLWNLDPTHPFLKPLKEFLDQFFNPQ